MANFQSLLSSLSPIRSEAEPNDAAPSRVAIISGGVITFVLLILLLVV